MKAYLYNIHCITNLHVGRGESQSGLIDKEVQRDPVLGMPCIPGSAIKGALREYLTNRSADRLDDRALLRAFGASPQDDDMNAGELKFIGATLLAYPVQRKGVYGDKTGPYIMRASRACVDHINQIAASFGLQPVDSHADDSKNLDSVQLPVVARNSIGGPDKTGSNLWYEEFVPHQAEFVCAIAGDDAMLLDEIDKHLDGHVVQFGANSSVGYGLCRLTNLTKEAQ